MSHGNQRMTDRKTNRRDRDDKRRDERPALDEVWPVHSAGGWPQDLSLDRAEIYEGRT